MEWLIFRPGFVTGEIYPMGGITINMKCAASMLCSKDPHQIISALVSIFVVDEGTLTNL